MTDRMSKLPVDPARNLPIPFASMASDGTPDFAAIQGGQSLRCARERLCGVCGEKLDYWIAFLGGPQAAEFRTYTDPPMHEECAEAATRLCPHIARSAPKRSSKLEKRPDVITPSGFVEDKPAQFVMILTRGFTWGLTPDGALVFRAHMPRRRRVFAYDDEGVLVEQHRRVP